MKNGRTIRDKLHDGGYVYSTAVTAVSHRWPEVLAAADLDFVFIDSEHTPLGRETLAWLCRSYAAAGLPPVVRIPSPDAYEAAKVLDGGATGFIAPYVETAEQVRQLVSAARYRPLKGARAAAAVRDPNSLELELAQYLQKRNVDTIFIANIESVPAIENLDEILSVGGLDAVLIGPHDLSCSLGIPEQYEHPKFDTAVRTIFEKARAHQVGAGIHVFWANAPQQIDWCRNAGGNLIVQGADLRFFTTGLTAEMDQIRAALEDTISEAVNLREVV